MKKILLACLVFLAVPVCFAADDNKGQCAFNGIDYDKAVQFVTDFKQALNKSDKKTLATMMAYPLRVNTAPGKFFTIKNKDEFVQKYNSVFSSELAQAIQQDAGIFCNSQGAMIGGGVWFNTEGKKAKVFAVSK